MSATAIRIVLLAGAAVAALLCGRPGQAAGPPTPEAAVTPPILLSFEELERYTGDFWEHEEGFAAEVRVIDGKLWAVHSPTRRNELVAVGPDRFTMLGTAAEVYVEYTMDEHGVVEVRRTIDGELRGRFKPFTRRQASAGELAEYAGDYYGPEADIVYALAVENGKLMFRRGAEAPQELVPMFGDTFEIAEYGSFTFERGADGRITGFLLRSGKVRSRAIRRQ